MSPSPEPDLDGGELKTTVRGTDGRFRESLKICMSGKSPMTKLEHIYLVIARDLNDSQVFTRRVVKNERVISLRPPARVRRALEFDELLLHEHPRAKETHFLETRTAGTRDSSTRAYYIRASALDSYIAETVVRREFEQVERALRGLQVTDQTLLAAGISLAPKNRVGMLIAKKARAGKLYSQLRQGPVDERGENHLRRRGPAGWGCPSRRASRRTAHPDRGRRPQHSTRPARAAIAPSRNSEHVLSQAETPWPEGLRQPRLLLGPSVRGEVRGVGRRVLVVTERNRHRGRGGPTVARRTRPRPRRIHIVGRS